MPEDGVPPPLAQMTTTTIDLGKLVGIADKAFRHVWHLKEPCLSLDEAIGIVTDPSIFRHRVLIDAPAPPPRSFTKNIYCSHLEQLLDWKKVQWVPKATAPDTPSPFYTRIKSNMRETRPIWAAIPSNSSQQSPPKLVLPSLRQSIDLAFSENRNVSAASIDMVGWFGQIPINTTHLPIAVPKELSSRTEFLVWCVLPQGWSWSPILAQTFSEALLTGLCVKGIIYDNYLLAGSDEEVERDLAELKRRCALIGAEINIEKSTMSPARIVIHCGAELNMETKAFRNEPKWCTAAEKLLDLATKQHYLSHRSVFHLAGTVNWLLQVRRIPFACFRPVLTAMRVVGRRVGRGRSWNAPFCKNDHLQSALHSALSLVKKNEPINWTPVPGITQYVYSDASDWGMGFVIFTGGKLTTSFTRPWTQEEKTINIADREAIAWFAAYERAEPGSHFFIDNVVLAGGLRRGHSARNQIDSIIRSSLPLSCTISRIPSDLMIADPLSRGIDADLYIKYYGPVAETQHSAVLHLVNPTAQHESINTFSVDYLLK